MDKNILVTGGAGYIGSHTVAQLCEDGFNVVILDNLSTSCEESVVSLRKITGKEIPLYKVDIRDKDSVCKVLKDEKIEAIIHFAAILGRQFMNNVNHALELRIQELLEEKKMTRYKPAVESGFGMTVSGFLDSPLFNEENLNI